MIEVEVPPDAYRSWLLAGTATGAAVGVGFGLIVLCATWAPLVALLVALYAVVFFTAVGMVVGVVVAAMLKWVTPARRTAPAVAAAVPLALAAPVWALWVALGAPEYGAIVFVPALIGAGAAWRLARRLPPVGPARGPRRSR